MNALIAFIIFWSVLALSFLGVVTWALIKEYAERKRMGKEGFPHTRTEPDKEKQATSH